MEHLNPVLQGCMQEYERAQRNTWSFFQEILKEDKLTVRISWRGFVKNPLAVRCTRVMRRLQPHQKVKIGRIESCRIVVGFPVSRSIRQRLSWC
jgi:hypothetical protein